MSHDPTAPPAPTPSTRPHLTPQFCFNTTALRDFLRLSRATVDDSLSLHLNSLLQPARRPFQPSSTASSAPPTAVPAGARTRRQIPGSVCSHFKRHILFPSWADRELVLTYCADVADSPDAALADSTHWGTRPAMHMPSDKMSPEQQQQQQRPQQPPTQAPPATDYANTDAAPLDPYAAAAPPRPRTFWGQEQVTDERTDPYSGRDYSYTREGRAATLRTVLDSERGVERIVRARTWSVLGERCLDDGGGGDGGDDYEGGWRRWMDDNGR